MNKLAATRSSLALASILALSLSLSACEKPFEHTIFADEHYGPWQSDLGRKNVLCYGRKTQIPGDCGKHMFVQDDFIKNPEETALTPYALEQIRIYAASVAKGTSTTFKSDGLIYKLRFDSPKPQPNDTCRQVNVNVRPSGGNTQWHNFQREFCF